MGRSLLVALVSLLVLAGCGDDTSGGGLHGESLDPPFTVADTALTDTSGEEYSLTAGTDKPLTLVFFGYTHCPDICGIVMANLATAMTRLSDSDRARVDVVYVTTDPARDTEKALRTYLDRLDPAFIGLTGDLDDIVAVAKPLGVGITHGERLPSGGYDVAHGTTVTGIDSHDEAPVYWSQETSAAEYADDIHQLLTKGN
ncbi:MAG TPA: SCO family protein [Nocardioides sp.]|nr:SCO family protein [Nocardioides sp.]